MHFGLSISAPQEMLLNKPVSYSRQNSILVEEMRKISERYKKGEAYETFTSRLRPLDTTRKRAPKKESSKAK
jgi:hypothetical protein